MSSKTSKRKSVNMENGNHETNGKTESEDLKGFPQEEVVIKDLTVVLTHVPVEVEEQIETEEPEKRLTRNQKKEDEVVEEEDTEKRVTRSQTKENNSDIVDVETKEETETVVVEPETNGSVEIAKLNGDLEAKEISDVEKDLEPDETEPELQFDENSDRDSGKNSPASRCLTRRSHLRNVPTPKTPKSPLETPSEEDDVKVDLNASNETFIGSDDLSTQAQPGNDTTQANVTVNEEEPQQPSEFLQSLKDKSLSETLRGISSRRTIHLRHAHITKSDFGVPYPKRVSVESISGVKRRHRSPSPEDNKRVKRDGGGLLSYIKSPVFGVRHHFSKDLPSSTPKLTGFRNKNSLLDGDEIDKIKLEVEDTQQEKKWCSIM